jgi:4'-phosphopantetheinyl transferase
MHSRSRRFSTTTFTDRPRAGLECPGKVDLWQADLECISVALRRHLSAHDWQESRLIGSDTECEIFLKVRSAIRSVLAGYLECSPEEMEFERHPGGLRLAAPNTLLRFHHSHSANLLLVAVSFARQVGLDVEYMRDDLPFETLADYYFDPRDARTLRYLEESDRMRHFYQEWTSSEASRHVANQSNPSGHHGKRWSLLNFTPARGFSAALAVEGGDFQLDWRRWS